MLLWVSVPFLWTRHPVLTLLLSLPYLMTCHSFNFCASLCAAQSTFSPANHLPWTLATLCPRHIPLLSAKHFVTYFQKKAVNIQGCFWSYDTNSGLVDIHSTHLLSPLLTKLLSFSPLTRWSPKDSLHPQTYHQTYWLFICSPSWLHRQLALWLMAVFN